MRSLQLSRLLLLSTTLSVCDCEFVNPSEMEKEGTAENRLVLPTDIYPRVMVVADIDLQKKIGGCEINVRQYIQQLFGLVQQVYDTIAQPKFHLRIADIYLCRDQCDCSYISKNKVGNLLEINGEEFMNEMVSWANERKNSSVSYDLLLTLTSLEMYRNITADGKAVIGTGLSGKASLGGVCGVSNTGIITDNGGFASVKSISHELAHLFGAVHDGDIGGGEECKETEGFIMGMSTILTNRYRPSPCTIRSMARHISSAEKDCVKVDEPGKYPLDHTLPGVNMPTDEQCKMKYGPESMNCPFFGDVHNSNVCNKHYCYYPVSGTCRAQGGAFSGTSCGLNKLEAGTLGAERDIHEVALNTHESDRY
ncbi:A disintegrin and metalloproteinase with thrombospondin motifs like [Watersipora subatra]|uniref:A disintegrin and metalloproteinase with thrombospondin motifs like n=1 Tax=Watersipora subatra TaxID=2589382 RepID=UPI00355B2BC2